MGYLLIHGYVHAESEHSLYPVSVGLGVHQLVAGSQRGRLKQHHSQIFCRLVPSILLKETLAVRLKTGEARVASETIFRLTLTFESICLMRGCLGLISNVFFWLA